ncbi:MAG: malonyl-CoA synthase [Planktomarina sp.]|nr:malonyl-CoA synthase [Planktomarina sp.]
MNPLADALVTPLTSREDTILIRHDATEISGVELYLLTGQIANVLQNHGVEPGHRVAMQTEKTVEALALYLACLRTGAVFLPLNTAYTPTEMEYFIDNAKPTVVVCDPKSGAILSKFTKLNGIKLLTLDSFGKGSLNEEILTAETTFTNVARSPEDLAAILYTSGTTGRSKGAMLSHENLLSNADSLCEVWRFTPNDVLLHSLPIFHVHGLFVAINVLLRAQGKIIFLPKFSVDQIIEFLPKATSMMGVPTFYTRLLSDVRFTKNLTKHMRLFVSGSAPLLSETHRTFETRTGHRILERYGMTETTMNTSNPYDGERRAGTVGFPLPGVEARVTDEKTGAILKSNEIGILEVRGPNVFKGYWRMPEKTKTEFRDDGFFITGDIAQIDSEGYVAIVGRAKDLIISGGYNIYPKEIEIKIDALENVMESAVIGAPHPDFGEAVIAVVVCVEGKTTTAEKVQTALQVDLANFKCPKAVFFLNELPRNTMGKVQKNGLRNQFEKTFQKNQ